MWTKQKIADRIVGIYEKHRWSGEKNSTMNMLVEIGSWVYRITKSKRRKQNGMDRCRLGRNTRKV